MKIEEQECGCMGGGGHHVRLVRGRQRRIPDKTVFM